MQITTIRTSLNTEMKTYRDSNSETVSPSAGIYWRDTTGKVVGRQKKKGKTAL
jgi:hypothetical protein